MKMPVRVFERSLHRHGDVRPVAILKIKAATPEEAEAEIKKMFEAQGRSIVWSAPTLDGLNPGAQIILEEEAD
jgi:hypothetical protein